MREAELLPLTGEGGRVDPERLRAVEAWVGEPIVPPGDDPAEVLVEGTVWRTAFDEASEELAAGRRSPSPEWRRAYALPLGLQRMLSEPRPHLASGLELRPHQVDALAGMLAALLGDAERRRRDEGDEAIEEHDGELAAEAEADILGGDDPHGADGADGADDGDDDDDGDDLDIDEAVAERLEGEDDDEDESEAPPLHDPGASRRYRFKHPTASGKTVAAAGFVEAARLTGVLVLTHRRLLVEQFRRDLKAEGYAHRLRDAVMRAQPVPAVPPVTVETYAWFIRNVDTISRDTYGVVLCDEAHTALGERTAAAIRRLDSPTYVGMTATDQLLQKHVGDVFPAEIADFPLDEAVKRGVVAPLRAIRVAPGASLKRVKIVGGDFDQQELAAALDHDALNMAAAMLYADRFGNRPGIVYSAGVEHAHRVAAAMRAVGIKAAAVSGRTPPRELATTLAAYERGEINVLVNAQLLAEGWNAPRATVCMHLAPTASRRVYQQRVGRIMRLHRRKEAGVVVDFAGATAPHTDRTVTVHSLLGVDVYHPGALVTPRPPRRRQRWRRIAKPLVREAGWLVPVTADPLRRREIILTEWKQVAIDRLPLDEQEMWAENAGRKVGSKDIARLAQVLSNVPDETRMLFLATCAAENKNRALRLMALGDLAQHRPSANVLERAVRLVEAAPTWRLDRAQGARTLLLALGEGRVEAGAHQVVAWCWRLARASRDAQFRRVVAGLENGRDLARALSGTSGEASMRAAARIAATAVNAPLDVGAALLAVVVTQDAGAMRLLEGAKSRLAESPTALAAALGANIPLPRGTRRPSSSRPDAAPKRRPERKPTPAAPPAADETIDTAAGEPERSENGGKRRRKRRRRSRKRGAEGAVETVGAEGESAADGTGDGDADAVAAGEPGPGPTEATEAAADAPSANGTGPEADTPTRRRRRRRRSAANETAGDETPREDAVAAAASTNGGPVGPIADAAEHPAAAHQPPVPASPAAERTEGPAAVNGSPAAASSPDVEEVRPRRSRRRAEPVAVEPVTDAAATPVEAAAPAVDEPAPRPGRARRARGTAAAEAAAPTVPVADAPEVETPAPTRRARRTTAKAADAPAGTGTEAGTPATAAPDEPPAAPAPRTRRRPATPAADPGADAAPTPRPTRRRRTTEAAAPAVRTAAPEAAPTAAEETPRPRRRTARTAPPPEIAAPPAAENGGPAPRRRRARADEPAVEVAASPNGAPAEPTANGTPARRRGRRTVEEAPVPTTGDA